MNVLYEEIIDRILQDFVLENENNPYYIQLLKDKIEKNIMRKRMLLI